MRGVGILSRMTEKRNSYKILVKKSLNERDLLEYPGKDGGKKEIT
jgi:hypothetical protein